MTVTVVHIWKVAFEKQDKDLIDGEEPWVRAKEYSCDFAFTNEDEADNVVKKMCGIEVGAYGEWCRKTDEDGSEWFVYFEEPYELDPENPQLTEV